MAAGPAPNLPGCSPRPFFVNNRTDDSNWACRGICAAQDCLMEPLHPAIIHFPIVFSVLSPVILGLYFWLAKGQTGGQVRFLLAGFFLAFSLLTFAALQTGETDEEIVEKVVPEKVIHEHEEMAETFMVLVSVLTALVVVHALLPAVYPTLALGLAFALSLGVLGTGLLTGKKGGVIAYEYGGAAAHSKKGKFASGLDKNKNSGNYKKDEDDDDD